MGQSWTQPELVTIRKYFYEYDSSDLNSALFKDTLLSHRVARFTPHSGYNELTVADLETLLAEANTLNNHTKKNMYVPILQEEIVCVTCIDSPTRDLRNRLTALQNRYKWVDIDKLRKAQNNYYVAKDINKVMIIKNIVDKRNKRSPVEKGNNNFKPTTALLPAHRKFTFRGQQRMRFP